MIQKKSQGFTIIELLVVVTIIIVLTAITAVSFRATSQRSRNSKRESDIAQMRTALEIYRSSNGSYPVYAGSNQVTNFTNLLSNTSFTQFLANKTLADPTNTGSYRYEYVSAANGSTYSICYTSEPATTRVCQTNP